MKPDQERVRTLLTETITLLCKNGLHFKKQLRVQGLLGVTLDDDEVFIVHLNETLEEKSAACRISEESVQNTNEVSASRERAVSNGSPNRHIRKRRQFQNRSAISAEEVESEASLTVEDAPPCSRRLEISHSESIAEVGKHSSDSCHSYDATSCVPVKQEPNDDDLIVVAKSIPLKRQRLCGKSQNLIQNPQHDTSDDTTGERNNTSNRTLCEPTGTSELRILELNVSTKTELPDDDEEFDASGPLKFGMPNETPVQSLYNVAMSESLWTENQCLSDPGSSVQRFSAANIPDISWASMSQQNRTDCFPTPALFHFVPRPDPSHRISLPGVVPRRTRYSSEKTYVCQYAHCGKTFYQKYNLYRHQREKHGSLYP